MMFSELKNNYINFLNLLRFQDWRDKMQRIIVASLLVIIFSEKIEGTMIGVSIFFIYLFTLFSYAFIVNSYADRKKDIIVGKNYYYGFSEKFVKKILIILLLINVAIPFYYQNVILILLMASGLFVASFYSLKPMRYKEKGGYGLLAASIFQAYPFLIFLVLTPDIYLLVLYLFFWIVIINFFTEIAHQLGDYKGDKETDAQTFVVQTGTSNTLRFIYANSLLWIIYLFLILFIISVPEAIFIALTLFLFSIESLHFAANNIIKRSR